MKFTLSFFIVGILVLAAVSGCVDKFSRPAYETLYVGMPQAEVKDVLGSPDKQAGNTWTYRRNQPCEIAVIKFVDGKIAEKNWYDSPDACKDEPVECERKSLNR